MFEIREYMDKQYKTYELVDSEEGSYIKVVPERGGIITGFGTQGNELLYMDEDTFYDPAKYVRGGNPILFPICGTLDDGEYVYNGDKYKMENHGLVRNFPWKVVETDTEGKASIKIRFESTEMTKESYPFDFELIFTYTLKASTLTIDQEYINKSNIDIPMYAGFHPYFKISNKKNLKYEINASKYVDYGSKEIKTYNGGIDLTNEEKAKILLDTKENQVFFSDEDLKRKITLEYSKEFKYITLWSIIGENFICVEPWMAKPNSLNTKEDLFILKPHAIYKVYMSIKEEKVV